MFSKKLLGLYWGEDSFSLVETQSNKVSQALHIPFDSPLDDPSSENVPQGLKLSALLQKALTTHQITATKVHVTLCASDLVFRSFVIPWMEPHEIGNVVEFEATKYIPIKLDLLSFSYHAEQISENNQKKLRILFAAIRHDILDQYKEIIENAGLSINSIEPAPVSILRSLGRNDPLLPRQAALVLEASADRQQITIVQKGVIQFIRQAQFTTDAKDSTSVAEEILNNLRVSLNFYYRQNPSAKINKTIVISESPAELPLDELKREVDIPFIALAPAQILNTQHSVHIGEVAAFGIAIKKSKPSSKDFSFPLKGMKTSADQTAENISHRVTEYKAIIMTALTCGCLLGGWLILNKYMVKSLQKKVETLRSKQGMFASSSLDQLKEMKEESLAKRKRYDDIYLESNILNLLDQITQQLPSGVWLNSFKLQTTEQSSRNAKAAAQVTVSMDGYAFHNDTNKQFQIVGEFVQELQSKDDLKETFTDIKLVTIRQQQFAEYPATYFQITFNP